MQFGRNLFNLMLIGIWNRYYNIIIIRLLKTLKSDFMFIHSWDVKTHETFLATLKKCSYLLKTMMQKLMKLEWCKTSEKAEHLSMIYFCNIIVRHKLRDIVSIRNIPSFSFHDKYISRHRDPALCNSTSKRKRKLSYTYILPRGCRFNLDCGKMGRIINEEENVQWRLWERNVTKISTSR